MNYGFLIRNDRCIGCHACSTACKSENDVPLGVNRTWVKNVETGVYPNVRRHFQVTRCNHCSNPPCVRICPVEAMYQRDDGIVEFDPEICIGCKACLQACPYDAIYMDPESGTAAKCHYCAHRTDVGLEPACVVVCPEHAIVAGDMDDPDSEISEMLARFQVTVRKPEQGTAPKLFYVDGDDAALSPLSTERAPESFAWADSVPLHRSQARDPLTRAPGAGDAEGEKRGSTSGASRRNRHARSGAILAEPRPQGSTPGGPIRVDSGRMADRMVRNVYNAQHQVPWHWPVPAYLVTKAVGTGAVLLLILGWLLGVTDTLATLSGGLMALVAMAATGFFLVLDLERPERFLSILYRPQWRSWLTRGAYIITGYSLLLAGWWGVEVGVLLSRLDPGLLEPVRTLLVTAGAPLALATAAYTAFLFGQAEGRDLWQSTLLPVHLVVQAFLAGASALLLLAPLRLMGAELGSLAVAVLTAALLLDLAVVFLGEFAMPHASAEAARAREQILRGPYALDFWVGGLVVGHLVPLVLLVAADSPWLLAVAGVSALVGLFFYERAFVMAPQEVPNS